MNKRYKSMKRYLFKRNFIIILRTIIIGITLGLIIGLICNKLNAPLGITIISVHIIVAFYGTWELSAIVI